MHCITYSFSTCVRDRKCFGFILHLSAQYLCPENNSPCKSNYFGSLPLLPHFSIFKKVYTHVPQWFLLAWVICNYDYLLSPSFHPDVALEHQRTQPVWQVSPQTGKLNGSAANQGAPFPTGQWLKSSSGNKWSENLLWPARAAYPLTGTCLNSSRTTGTQITLAREQAQFITIDKIAEKRQKIIKRSSL